MPQSTQPNDLPEPLRVRLHSLVNSDHVVLFMKGSRTMPRCGFSKAVVDMLNEAGATYTTVDVLADNDVREGIKVYSQWPTIPQLFVGGEMLGGADIARELAQSGELQRLVRAGGAPKAAAPSTTTTPRVSVSPAALAILLRARDAQPADQRCFRLRVSSQFKHTIGFGPQMAGDTVVQCGELVVCLDAASSSRADGVSIDVEGEAFRIDNPHAPRQVARWTVKELADKREAAARAGQALHIFDVRTPHEREQAVLPGTTLFDDAGQRVLASLPKSTQVVFMCHHGGRSLAAAEHALQSGYLNVVNVEGGIDAWSREIDASVRRY